MFDIGQNDVGGAFYSKSFDQVLASIPYILQEFEAGIAVSFNNDSDSLKIESCVCLKTVCRIFVQKLYDAGARFFWIHNTGPVGCLPQNIAKFGTDPSKLDTLGCVAGHNQAAQLFNLQLHALCKKLQGQYADSNVTYVDIYTIKSNLLSNYSRYGEFLNFN